MQERFDETIPACREAMQERTRERGPFRWAQTQEKLAFVYRALFDKTREPHHLGNKLGAVSGALEDFREAKAAFYIEKAERLPQQILASSFE